MNSNIKEMIMEKLHFIAGYLAQNFDLHNIPDPLDMPSRSKSKEHIGRLTAIKNTQKITKNEENES